MTVPIGAVRASAANPQQTLPPSQPAAAAPASAVDLESYLAPPQGPGEIGRLGGYRVLRLLGSGGMGVVLQAEDARLHRAVALKIMQPGLAAVNEHRERFLQEARIAAAVEHDNIITIYQVDEQRGLPFIAMPMLRGETLEDRLRKSPGPQPIPFVIRVAREIAAGLEAAHQANLIHRDIKPSNIWLEAGRDRVKILDFGLARVIHSGSQMTQSGVVLGTPGYLAPEQVGGQPVSTACDRFSFGAVLYRMCTGTLPFQGNDILSLLAALATTTPRPVREVNPNVPPQLADLVMRMLARKPEARPTDREIIERLTALEGTPASNASCVPIPSSAFDGYSTPEDPTFIPGPAPAKKSFRTAYLVAAAGVVGFFSLVLMIGVALLAFRGCGAKPQPELVNEPPKEVPKPSETDLALTFIEETLRNNRAGRIPPVGFALGNDFEDTPPEGALLIGFEIGIGKTPFNDGVRSLRPIFLTRKGEVLGTVRAFQRRPVEQMVVVKAKPGYAVGTIHCDARLAVEGMRLTFNRVGNDGLKLDDRYHSEWIGSAKGNQTLNSDSALVIGITGRTGGDGRCVALGLVTTPIQK